MKKLVIAAAVAALACGAAQAATVKKPKKEAMAPKGSIVIVNSHKATLSELTLTKPGGAPTTVASGLAPGKSLTVKLPPKQGCTFDIAGQFDDESNVEVPGMDLCKERKINLTE